MKSAEGNGAEAINARPERTLGEEPGGCSGGGCGRLQLRSRDRELLAHTAIARYLSEGQIKKLVFRKAVRADQRNGKRSGELVIGGLRTRLAQLCRAGGSPLRQLAYRDEDGVVRKAYCVTMVGYAIARSHLRQAPALPPIDKAGDLHIAHTIALNDLYVGLATAKADALARAAEQPFAWTAESLQLPWREFDSRKGETEGRRLIPDAIVELPVAKARVFVECEMGGHPIVRQPRSDNDSILSKVRRYSGFVHTPGDGSHYATRFPDCWTPELLFLVRTDERAAAVEAVLRTWREENPGHALVVRALALRGALCEYAPRAGLPAPPPKPFAIDPALVLTLLDALQHAAETFKSVRHFADAAPGLKGFPIPQYTPAFRRAYEVAPLLRKALAEARK